LPAEEIREQMEEVYAFAHGLKSTLGRLNNIPKRVGNIVKHKDVKLVY